jgi:hypothetical protein
MKTNFIAFILLLCALSSCGQNQIKQTKKSEQNVVLGNEIYQLFPTQNYWTFIKLNTRNGKMWQVHFSVGDDKNTGDIALNSIPLVTEEKEINGRFTLYPTENMYNFLLLDQIDGTVVQVQWSVDAKNRGIVSVIKTIE